VNNVRFKNNDVCLTVDTIATIVYIHVIKRYILSQSITSTSFLGLAHSETPSFPRSGKLRVSLHDCTDAIFKSAT
jgi:hypothetical protein